MACGSPTSPSEQRSTYTGTLRRDGQTATLTLQVVERGSGSTKWFAGDFTATFAEVTYLGSALGTVDSSAMSGTLTPTSTGRCSLPFSTDGQTTLRLVTAGGQLTGDAIVARCEGTDLWTATLSRR
jgi:hypothetical protein